ncbi:MAG: hypothetical protein Ct9H300mP14_06150 [Gammaproteobacteria bacterium]|nr:MAG: hypothetical protein Ct9H300mP14_06150 [Gammaproteobacteria bacterium]
MEQLQKMNRVIQRLDDSAPHEILLVVDAATGQKHWHRLVLLQRRSGSLDCV